MRRPENWRPSDVDKERLLAFEGYGPDLPHVVFVGLEEYCVRDPQGQRDNIWIRCTHPVFSEVRTDKDRARALFGHKRKTVPVWKVMATIVSKLTGRSLDDEYAALGSRPARGPLTTWLTELRPLPRPGTDAFQNTYIAEWFGDMFRSKAELETASVARAGRRLLHAIVHADSPPQYAFFYGKTVTQWARHAIGPFLGEPLVEIDNNIVVGRTAGGTRIVLTGFYAGQHAATAFRAGHVPMLLSYLRAAKE